MMLLVDIAYDSVPLEWKRTCQGSLRSCRDRHGAKGLNSCHC